jgi:hypothetical protein
MSAVVTGPEILRLAGCIEQALSVEEYEAAARLFIYDRDRPSELAFKGDFDDWIQPFVSCMCFFCGAARHGGSHSMF